MKARVDLGLALACIVAWTYPDVWAADTVRGRVLELGQEGGNGIGHVEVALKSRVSGAPLGNPTLTDENGSYVLPLGTRPEQVVLHFDKIDYIARNVQRDVTDPTRPQGDVWLKKRDADDDSQAIVAAIVSQSKSGGGNGRYEGFFATFSALPQDRRAMILNGLRLRAPNAYAQFDKADKTSQALFTLTDEIESKTDAPDAGTVRAYANFGEPGKVRLYGKVPTPADKKYWELMVKNKPGIDGLTNDIEVKK